MNQTQQAIVLQFGKIVNDEILGPGPHFKVPFLQNVVYFDKRLLGFASEMRETIASDQKRVLVDTYTKYRINNPLLFYQTVRGEANLMLRVSPIVESITREAIAKVPLSCFVADCRDSTTNFIKKATTDAAKKFGIEIVDVRIKSVGLPQDNLESIFSRMKTDRTKEAKEIRATGFQERSIITSAADKESDVILSDAQLTAANLRGKADANSADIYNKAFSQDLCYFQYLRYLETYKKTLKTENTFYILNGESDYLKFLLKNINYNCK